MIRFSGDFFYFKRRIIYIMLFFYLLDKWCELVYTNSVVNREVIRNVVTRNERLAPTHDLWEG